MNYLKQHLPLFVEILSEMKKENSDFQHYSFLCLYSKEFEDLWGKPLFREALKTELILFLESNPTYCQEHRLDINWEKKLLSEIKEEKDAVLLCGGKADKSLRMNFLQYLITKLT